MAYDPELADRIREALADEPRVREVRMFGGLSFMVNEKITATANPYGQLMVRCDPTRANELLAREGAHRVERGGRTMSKGWLVIDAERVESAESLNSWLKEALDYNHRTTSASDG